MIEIKSSILFQVCYYADVFLVTRSWFYSNILASHSCTFVGAWAVTAFEEKFVDKIFRIFFMLLGKLMLVVQLKSASFARLAFGRVAMLYQCSIAWFIKNKKGYNRTANKKFELRSNTRKGKAPDLTQLEKSNLTVFSMLTNPSFIADRRFSNPF